MLHYRTLLFFFLLLAAPLLSAASTAGENSCSSETPNCRPVGEWSLGLAVGVGVRTNPLLDGKEIPLVLLPSINYYGEKFFIDNLDIGYTLVDSDDLMFNLVVTPGYDRVYFERWDVGNILVNIEGINSPTAGNGNNSNDNFTEIKANELKDRHFGFLGGMEISAPFAAGEIQFGLFKDLSGLHSGTEARLAFASDTSKNGWQGTIGFTWKDSRMTDYYYGVDTDEVVDNRAFYQADSSLNPFIRLSWHQQQKSSGAWRLGLEYQHLDASISQSPLVDKDYVVTFFIGKQYRF